MGIPEFFYAERGPVFNWVKEGSPLFIRECTINYIELDRIYAYEGSLTLFLSRVEGLEFLCI